MRIDAMESKKAVPDAQTLALLALAWLMADGPRAERFLALTGLSPAMLRTAIGNPAVLAAVLDHLASHEPDLLACADAIACTPAALVDARARLTA
ncbi:DUF3572 family protein [Sphingobium algorifonticola]|uniref:DUF3572 family protein n=1 Tax=Sphingobium algorifonticola TaxID=2008318 RepID=A0A437JDB9_9SPHN|nr:DUF3572 family protein [Sphingobium algorifonticola]RVT43905.1 DUF3572 family protein [Sphingobium algorifonticola]